MKYVEKMTERQLFLLSLGTCLGVFLISVNGFIINIALPTIAGELGVRQEISIWLITFFTLPYTVAVCLAGNLCVIHGNKKIYVIGLGIFVFASILCSFATNYNYLLGCRVIQGFGGGMLVPSSRGLVVLNYPPERRMKPLMWWAFSVFVGPAFGPVIGGAFSNMHWHWVFLVTLPLAAICLYLVLSTPSHRPLTTQFKLDWIGFVLMILIILSAQIIMDRGQIYDWFHSPIIVICFVTLIVVLPFFLIWECFLDRPMVYIQAFANRNFTIAVTGNCITMGCLFASFSLDVFWLHHIMGYPPIWAGLSLLPVGLCPLVFYPNMPRLYKIFDVRLIAVVGALAFVVGFYLKSRINLQISFAYLATARLIQGLGFPFLTGPNSLMYSKGIPDHKLPIIAAFYSFSRMLISGIAVSLGITLWIHRKAFYQTRLAARTYLEDSRFTSFLSEVKPLANSAYQATAIANKEVVDQASTLALQDIYYAFTWICSIVCVLVLFYQMNPKAQAVKAKN